MGKFKRELVPGSYLTAADMLSTLSQQQLKAAALEGRILLAVEPPVAWLLDSCCVGRAAMQSAAPMLPTAAGGEDSSMRDAQLAALVVSIAGLNAASEEVSAQYEQHRQRVWAAQQRKASRGKRGATVAALPMQTQGGGTVQVSLVQVSLQEAVFLSHVLRCCEVYVGTSSAGVLQQQDGSAQQGLQGMQDGVGMISQEQQQHHGMQEAGSSVPAAVLAGRDLWQWCCQHTAGGAGVFAPHCAAYHHLRSLGWLPLPGLAYGADYVLYQLHPELAHSDFVVTVMVAGDAREAAACMQEGGVQGVFSGLEEADAAQQGGQQGAQQGGKQDGALISQPSSLPSTQLAWLDACIMHRLARQVLKEMMLLYVVVPPGLSLVDFDCIHEFQVREVLVQRWVPSEHREGR
jgi:hypothetical protein